MTPPSYWYGFAAHLRVGADGRLHALAHLDSLTYLTCAASCDSGASWQRVAFDSLVGPGALALGPDGSVFVVAGRRGGGAVLARCDTGCAVRTAWHWTVIDFTLQVLDAAIASAPDGKPVIALTTPFDVYVALMR
jgi:hypothetical protein